MKDSTFALILVGVVLTIILPEVMVPVLLATLAWKYRRNVIAFWRMMS